MHLFIVQKFMHFKHCIRFSSGFIAVCIVVLIMGRSRTYSPYSRRKSRVRSKSVAFGALKNLNR